MKTDTKNKLKAILFEISPKEKKDEILLGDYLTLQKSISMIADAVNKLTVRHEQSISSLSTYVQENINALRSELTTSSQGNYGSLESTKQHLLSVYGEYKKNTEGLTVKENSKLKKEIQRQLDELVGRVEKLGDLRPKYWGGSSRSIYNNSQGTLGNPMSPGNLYSDINLIPGDGISFDVENIPDASWVNLTITATGGGGGGTLQMELPTGDIDGNNKDFVVTHDPVMFTWDGQVQNPLISPPDYTYDSGTMTVSLATAPLPGSNVLSFYQ